MSKTIAIILGVFGSFVLVVALLFGYGVGVFNQGNSFENALKAEKENNRNILSNYGKKLIEASQVPEMYRDDFLKVTKAQMEGRYGADGSKATFQFLKEQNIALDSKLYSKLQSLIEAGRNEFATGQTKMISVKQGYTTVLGSFPRGTLLGAFGYPKINLDDYAIVTDDRTETSFANKKEEALQLRK